LSGGFRLYIPVRGSRSFDNTYILDTLHSAVTDLLSLEKRDQSLEIINPTYKVGMYTIWLLLNSSCKVLISIADRVELLDSFRSFSSCPLGSVTTQE
jgi:hypothetical protein